LDWGWYGKKLDERDRDPLLLYIHKPRNSETHRLEALTEQFIPKLIVKKDDQHVLVTFETVLRPLPVSDDKGKVYDPPKEHRGHELDSPDVAFIAVLALNYLQGLVKEADSRIR